MDDNLCDNFLGAGSVSSAFPKFLERDFICFRILIILTNLINLTVLVPNLAALDALETLEMLAALFPLPVRYWVTQMRSKHMVMVLMISSQK